MALAHMMHGTGAPQENNNVWMHGQNKVAATAFTGKGFEERKANEVAQDIVDSGSDHAARVYKENEAEMRNWMSESKIGIIESTYGDEGKTGVLCRAGVKDALTQKETRESTKTAMKDVKKALSSH